MSRETIRLVLTISIAANVALGGLAAWALWSVGGFHARALRTRADVVADLEPQIYAEFRDQIERLEQELSAAAQAGTTEGMHSLPSTLVSELPASVFWAPQAPISRDRWNQLLALGQAPFRYSYNSTTGAHRFVCRVLSHDDDGVYPLDLGHLRFDDGRPATSLVPPAGLEAMRALYGDTFDPDRSLIAIGSVPGVTDVYSSVWIKAETRDGPQRFHYHAIETDRSGTVMFAIPLADARVIAGAASAVISTGEDVAALHPDSLHDLDSLVDALAQRTIARAKMSLPAARLVVDRD